MLQSWEAILSHFHGEGNKSAVKLSYTPKVKDNRKQALVTFLMSLPYFMGRIITKH